MADWKPGDHADVRGMPVELLNRQGVLWRCARLFPAPDGKSIVLVSEDLMAPFVADSVEDR